jgi:hypothetical protein
MWKEGFRWLAGVIAAHEGRKVVRRSRLQDTIYLLQRKGLPTDCYYDLQFDGPYSGGVNGLARLARQLDLVTEQVVGNGEGEHSIFQANESALLPEMQQYQADLDAIQQTPDLPLELAVNYDGFREMGYGHADALKRLRWKKASKWTPESEGQALDLLRQIGLLVDGRFDSAKGRSPSLPTYQPRGDLSVEELLFLSAPTKR